MSVNTSDNITTFSFTDDFIAKLADYIRARFVDPNADLSRLAIVFGGKRPALFVKRRLARMLGKGFVSPKFFTIEDFVGDVLSRHEPFEGMMDLENCYCLYKLAQKKAPSILRKKENFSQFLPWSREILSFIEQLDLEDVPNERLKNIEANAQIGYSVPKDINQLLAHIVSLRQAYHAHLKEHKVYSRGYQYLRAACTIGQAELKEFDHILFCGFFYLHKTEATIIKDLTSRGKASLLFQGDERRWPALKHLSELLNCSIREGEEVEPTEFDLKLYGCFDSHSQIGQVREILRSMDKTALSKTVIVLPDPDTAIPLLTEIAPFVEDFNVSMGYSLKRSSLCSLLTSIFEAQLSRRPHGFYARDYLKVLRHPFVKNLKISGNPSVTRVLVHKIEEILTGEELSSFSGQMFVELESIFGSKDLYDLAAGTLKGMGIDATEKELRQNLKELHHLLFEVWQEVESFGRFAASLQEFISEIKDKSSVYQYPLNLKVLERLEFIQEEMAQTSFNDEKFPKEDLFKIFENRLEQEMVSFLGSPLKGLQVLGLFETRSLSFEHVIMMDVNEGILPHLKIYEPLIPREVMISLNLDRLELEEEIQRYQFLRLISSAKTAHLVFQETKDRERSRFVQELIWEQEKKAGKLNTAVIHRPGFAVKIGPVQRKAHKTPAMIEFLKSRTYSASSINTYVLNPMEFYRNYVLGLKEREDLLDEPENRQVGIFVHTLLEETYKKFLGKKPVIDTAFKNYFFKRFEDLFAETFGRSMSSDAFLLKAVLSSRMRHFLQKEAERQAKAPTEVLFIEEKFENTIALSSGPARFVYKVDRVDRLADGTIMIIDYKTGAVDPMPKAIDKIIGMELSRANIKETVRSFQIPLYMQYLNERFKGQPVNAAFCNIRTAEMSTFITPKTSHAVSEILNTFLTPLDFIMSEILDPDVPFVEDES